MVKPKDALTTDQKLEVEIYLKEHYVLIKRESLKIIGIVLGLAGVGTIATAYGAAKVAIKTGAAAVATNDILALKQKAVNEGERIAAIANGGATAMLDAVKRNEAAIDRHDEIIKKYHPIIKEIASTFPPERGDWVPRMNTTLKGLDVRVTEPVR